MLSFLFRSERKERRRYPRRSAEFPAAWRLSHEDGERKALGLDLSLAGAGMLLFEEVTGSELDVRITLGGRIVPIRVKVARSMAGLAKGRKVWRYGFEFVGIAADDWDAVARWVKGEDAIEPSNRAQGDLQMVRMSADDADRLMPKALQDRLLVELVGRRRLVPFDSDQSPLVQYFYGGVSRRDGVSQHRLTILSRNFDDDGSRVDFRTTFYFDEAAKKITVAD